MSTEDFDAEAELSRLLEKFAESYNPDADYADSISGEDSELQHKDFTKVADQNALDLNTAALQQTGEVFESIKPCFSALITESAGNNNDGADVRPDN